MRYVPPKRLFISQAVQGTTSQKMVFFIFHYPFGTDDFTGMSKQNIDILGALNLNGNVLTALHENH
jgi:hypothetical protein